MFPKSDVSNDTVKRYRHQCIIPRKVDAKNPWNARQTDTLIYGNQGDESRHVASHRIPDSPRPVVGTLREPVRPAPPRRTVTAPARTRHQQRLPARSSPSPYRRKPVSGEACRGNPTPDRRCCNRSVTHSACRSRCSIARSWTFASMTRSRVKKPLPNSLETP